MPCCVGVSAHTDAITAITSAATPSPRPPPFAMDSLVDPFEDNTVLSYDDPVPVDSGTSTAVAAIGDGRSLADRISSNKVYLLSDASKPRVGKVRLQQNNS